MRRSRVTSTAPSPSSLSGFDALEGGAESRVSKPPARAAAFSLSSGESAGVGGLHYRDFSRSRSYSTEPELLNGSGNFF